MKDAKSYRVSPNITSVLSLSKPGFFLHTFPINNVYIIFWPWRPVDILWPFFLIFFYFIFKLYITVLVLPNIKMNPPQVYMCSPSRTPLPPPSPFHPSDPFLIKTTQPENLFSPEVFFLYISNLCQPQKVLNRVTFSWSKGAVSYKKERTN